MPGPDHPGLETAPHWPVTRLAGWSLMFLLLAALLAPVMAVAGTGGWPAIGGIAIGSTALARAGFEVVDGTGPHGKLSRVAAAVMAAVLGTAVLSGGAALLGLPWSLPVGGAMAGQALVVLGLAGAVRDIEVKLRANLRRVYFIGSQASERELERELLWHRDAQLVGSLSPGRGLSTQDLVEDALDNRATVVVIDSYALHMPAVREAASQLKHAGVYLRDLVSYYEDEFKKVPLNELSPTWFLFERESPGQLLYRRLRRSAEAIFAGSLLIFTAPILAIAAIAIRLTSPGPVLFRQARVGRGGAAFSLIKLRTMRVAARTEAAWAPSEGARITGVGRLLRRFRIDELPQLWNVVRGDLNLIGPRPEQVPIVVELERQITHYGARHCIRPGITGWAQVNLGYAGSLEGTVAKLQRDLYYAKHRSLRLDGLILWLTFKTVIAGRG
jgi:lipopolysaccharide/colanic/teichoic acid biosynthesis glycosyltransferase